MTFFIRIMIFGLVLLMPLRVSAGTLEDYKEAKKIYLATAACMAAYSNRTGGLVVAAFQQQGWKIEPYKQTSDNADAKFLLAWDTGSSGWDSYLLSVAGTENARDAKVDLRARKVYFAGSTLEEFAANAARKDLPPDAARVHEGFNQVAQLVLSVETEQAQDEQAGTARRLTSILLEDKDDKVYLVGHSLGGAVVTLVAARLIDMGVRPEQLEVISLGAPTVGNEAFVQQYDNKFPLTRIIVSGDPIPQALRRVYGGYRHFGKEIVWTVPDALKPYIPHDIPVYLDIAVKKYYPVRRQAMDEGLIPVAEPIAGKPRLYVAPIKNSLPKELQGEFTFMREGLLEQYGDILPGFVLDPGKSFDETTMKKAASAGCDLLAVPEIEAHKLQNDGSTYYVSLNQTVYRVTDGTVVGVGNYGSNTKVLTPMLAFLHDAGTMGDDSAAWIKEK